MVTDNRFRVTRSGREVYVGDLDGLVEVAAQSGVRANDLVYDPVEDRWIFARNLPALAGFALRGRRAVGTEDHRAAGPITLDRLTLERQAERRRRTVRALLLMALIGITLALVMMVPTGGDKSAYSDFIRDREKPPEGDIQPPSDPGEAAPPPASGGSANPGGQPAGTAERASGGGAATGGIAQPAGPGESDSLMPPPPNEGASPPPSAPPAELVFDYSQRDAPGVFVEPSEEDRKRYAARYTSEGMRALADPKPPPGDARLAQLLAARHRAQFARLQLEALDAEHPDIEQVDRLIADLEAEFGRACTPAYGEGFCALKLKYPDWPDPVVERVADGQAELGMTAEQAREAWGRPTRFRREGRGRRYCYDFLCERSLLIVDRVVVEVGG